MSKFEDFYEDLPHPVQMASEKEQLETVWNKALEEVRNSLAGKMRTEYGVTARDDKQVVDWNEIEHTLDKLKADE